MLEAVLVAVVALGILVTTLVSCRARVVPARDKHYLAVEVGEMDQR